MPVTFPVSTVNPREVKVYCERTPEELLFAARSLPTRRARMWQSSVGAEDLAGLSSKRNGFVHAVLGAYAGHHHLRIRPDDVWVAILTQFSFYVNAHVEELRDHFVAHAGKKELCVTVEGTRHTVSFGALAREMTQQIHANVVDTTLTKWILPDFTTTTLVDRTICSVLMMSTLEGYFNYSIHIICGIPSVTLEGTKSDWESIMRRLDRFYEFGDEPSAWADMLRPILSRFVSAFDGQPDVDFWKQVVYRNQQMCGQDDLSGWLTAFCVWSNTGKWNALPLSSSSQIARPLPRINPTVTEDAGRAEAETTDSHVIEVIGPAKGGRTAATPASHISVLERDGRYTLDGIPYFTIAVGSIPPGYSEVDVKVVDNGAEFQCVMVAGHLAILATAMEPDGCLDTLSPAPQWFIYEKA